MVTASRRTVRAGGPATAVRTWTAAGDDRPTVVLVHGIGVSHRYFRSLVEVLVPAADVVAVDLPGFGDSPRPRVPLAVEDHAEVLGAVLDELEVGEPVLLGHSMGSQVVTELAVRRPGWARRLVLVGPVVEPGARSAPRQAVRLLRAARYESVRANRLMVEDWLRAGPRWYAATLGPMLGYPLEERLGRVTEPVTLVRGEHDPVAPARYVRDLASGADRAVVREVPGEAHVVMVRRPEAVAAAALEPVGAEP